MICENCGNEHDGSYGSGRFCSKSCKCSFNAKKVKNHRCNFKLQSSKFGTWHCEICDMTFKTRSELFEHNHSQHPLNGRASWNSGLTKNTDARIKKQGLTLFNNIKTGWKTNVWWCGKHHSIETKRKLSLHGGKRPHSGRGKQGWYHGIWCDSSWELAWVVYNEEHEIKFSRYYGYFNYVYNGNIHKYYPDFQLDDGTFIEIKGYKTKQWEAKLSQLSQGVQIIVLDKEDIKPYLDYVIQKYGKIF